MTTGSSKRSLVDELRDCAFAHNGDFTPLDETTRSFLQEQWSHATAIFRDDGTTRALDVWWDKLWALHTEPSRHYHTVVHLHEMCHYFQLVLDANVTLLLHVDTAPDVVATVVRLAILFHDAIYDPTSSTNEEDSAKLFQEFVQAVGNDTVSVSIEPHVVECILATKTHQRPTRNNKQNAIVDTDDTIDALALFLDLDLSVLGKQPDAYQQYAALIRREYAFVPRDVYCTKRADILHAMVQTSPHLYHTTLCAHVWDARARDNLHAELDMLRHCGIPGHETD